MFFYLTTYSPEGGCAQGTSFLWGITTTKCGRAGGDAGIVYDLVGEELTTKTTTVELGAGITSAPTATGPSMIISTSGGNEAAEASTEQRNEVGDADYKQGDQLNQNDPNVNYKTPTVSRIEYWRELLQ